MANYAPDELVDSIMDIAFGKFREGTPLHKGSSYKTRPIGLKKMELTVSFPNGHKRVFILNIKEKMQHNI
jgi:hypothetical protein